MPLTIKFKKIGFPNGKKSFMYAVSGPAKEIAEFVATECARRNKLAEELSKTESGEHIYWVSPVLFSNNNEIPKASYVLELNYNKTAYFPSFSGNEMEKWQRREKLVDVEYAKLIAAREFGTVEMPVRNNVAPAPATKEEAPAPSAEQLAIEAMQGEHAGVETLDA